MSSVRWPLHTRFAICTPDRRAWLIAALGAGIGGLWGLINLSSVARPLQPGAMLAAGLQEGVLLFSVGFVIEEVSFRGLVDAHIHRRGESRNWLSSLFESALWGLWHGPVGRSLALLEVLVPLVVGQHCAVGVPLSFAWRRSGNLVPLVSAHAAIDAVRDAVAVAI